MAYYYDDSSGVSLSAIMLGGVALIAMLLWLNEALKPRTPPPSPPPPAPDPAPKPTPAPEPKKAPAAPCVVSTLVEDELRTLKHQIAAYSADNMDPLIDPAAARILGLIRDFEARMEAHHERLRRMIEK